VLQVLPGLLLGAVYELVYHNVRKQEILRIARSKWRFSFLNTPTQPPPPCAAGAFFRTKELLLLLQFQSQNEKIELRSAFLGPF
jgi:hypothetical protein